MPYSPSRGVNVTTVDALRNYVDGELKRISQALNETTALDLRPVHVAPLRPREGMIVFADGTDWNPGAGKGVYSYSGGAWVKLF